ncbi:Hypothetical predicted protein [Scomber scombrus]|uniref:Secreted protein n=1 Tax=Scomber scombrus TaxID=13677 RepID=A0AAV1QDG9_SCOSC
MPPPLPPLCVVLSVFAALASDPLCRDEQNSEQQQQDSEERSDARHDLSKLPGDEDDEDEDEDAEDDDEDEDEERPGAGQLH